MRPFHIIVTCEHAGNQIPKAYKYLFHEQDAVLASHRGWDIGALEIAQKLSNDLKAKLFETDVSRLLIDCNRSIGGADLFSEYTMALKRSVKDYLIEQYYLPYRKKVEAYIANHCKRKPLLHFSIHTFTPVLHGQNRLVDIGLLFDEDRPLEKSFCEHWQKITQKGMDDKLVMLNVPYNGADDGFTTYLRKRFQEEKYLGIELEINQKWVGTNDLDKMLRVLLESLELSLSEVPGRKLIH